MQHLTEALVALVAQHQVEARQKASEDRRARAARREGDRPSLLRRIRGIR